MALRYVPDATMAAMALKMPARLSVLC